MKKAVQYKTALINKVHEVVADVDILLNIDARTP